MIYLLHPSGAIAACESEPAAQRYEARGYTRCALDSFRQAWLSCGRTRLLPGRRSNKRNSAARQSYTYTRACHSWP